MTHKIQVEVRYILKFVVWSRDRSRYVGFPPGIFNSFKAFRLSIKSSFGHLFMIFDGYQKTFGLI
jgi:hypothetical protein